MTEPTAEDLTKFIDRGDEDGDCGRCHGKFEALGVMWSPLFNAYLDAHCREVLTELILKGFSVTTNA